MAQSNCTLDFLQISARISEEIERKQTGESVVGFG